MRACWGLLLAIVLSLLAAGCTPTPLDLKERAFLIEYDRFKRDSKERDLQKEALEYWRSTAASASTRRRGAEAERDYNRLALSGAAGTNEQLIAIKKRIDDPGDGSRVSTSGPRQSDVDHALTEMNSFELTYDNEARKVHDNLLPPLIKAASEYTLEYDTTGASGLRPDKSRKLSDALKDLREQVAQDRAWVLSLKLRQHNPDSSSKGSKKR